MRSARTIEAARAYGFESWSKLKAFVEGATDARVLAAVRAGDLPQVRSMLQARPELSARGAALHVARAGIEVHGVDLSQPMLTDFEERLKLEPKQVRARVSLAEGDMLRALDGRYSFAPDGGLDGGLDRAGTLVTYDLRIDLSLPMPGLVKRRAGALIVHNALQELKRAAEGT